MLDSCQVKNWSMFVQICTQKGPSEESDGPGKTAQLKNDQNVTEIRPNFLPEVTAPVKVMVTVSVPSPLLTMLRV